MANYCENCLSIKATPEVTTEIIEFVKSEENEFDFNRIIPMPEGIYMGPVGTKERELYPLNWYDWSIENWGTKWNSECVEIDGEDIRFETAWSPCLPVIEALAERFPEARFWYRYYETGMCFGGAVEFINDKRVYCMEGEYYENPLCEEDDEFAQEYELHDNRFPIEQYGIRTEVDETYECQNNGKNCTAGKIYYREYENGKIYRMIDGIYFDCVNEERKIYW